MKPTRAIELCQAGRSQLLIVDVQDRLCRAMPPDCLERVMANMARLIEAAKLLGIPVTATEQYPKGLGSTRDEIADRVPGRIFACAKKNFSCCTAPGFEERLKEHRTRTQIVIAGLEAHISIIQTAAGLQKWGYTVFVVFDAVCSRSLQNCENALQRIRDGGGSVTGTESVVFEWLSHSSHPRFKEVTALLK